jgi:ketosteroid isomerase-like protein
MGRPDTAALKRPKFVTLLLSGAVLLLIAMSPGRTQAVFADAATPCDVGGAGEGRFAAGEMSRRLERAWNTSDAQTLALFADNARVLTQWGQTWEGKSQISSFVDGFFDQGKNVPARPVQTLAQCEDGDTVIWTFRYRAGVNSAMIGTAEDGQFVKLYWLFLPYEFEAPESGPHDSASGSEARVSATVQASAIALAGAGLMYLVVLWDAPRRPGRVSGELISALRARVEKPLPALNWDAPTLPVDACRRLSTTSRAPGEDSLARLEPTCRLAGHPDAQTA